MGINAQLGDPFKLLFSSFALNHIANACSFVKWMSWLISVIWSRFFIRNRQLLVGFKLNWCISKFRNFWRRIWIQFHVVTMSTAHFPRRDPTLSALPEKQGDQNARWKIARLVFYNKNIFFRFEKHSSLVPDNRVTVPLWDSRHYCPVSPRQLTRAKKLG
jgi:hypothetical protein